MWVIVLFGIVATVVSTRWLWSRQSLANFLGLALIQLYARLWHRLKARGTENLPSSGMAILVSNHTSSPDAAFLSACCRRPLSFILAVEYYKIPLLHNLLNYMGCVPAHRNGQDAVAVRCALRILSAGRILCIFPEGGLSNAGSKKQSRGKAGAALLALRSRAPVIPALITGGPQTDQVLKAWLYPSRSQTRVIFGRPVDLSAYYGRPINRKLLEEVTRVVTDRIALLNQDISLESALRKNWRDL